jgi:hypothetical protein
MSCFIDQFFHEAALIKGGLVLCFFMKSLCFFQEHVFHCVSCSLCDKIKRRGNKKLCKAKYTERATAHNGYGKTTKQGGHGTTRQGSTQHNL